ncbi:hypothetical protein KS447_10115 [Staphylococcus aureus]|nr:hypothetical protein [Staphylococcus aureus]
MVKFKVVRAFKDIEHNQHKYKVGELYPAEGYNNPRVELLTNQIKNKYDKVYIVPLDKLTKQELLELCESLQKKRLVQWLKLKSSTY